MYLRVKTSCILTCEEVPYYRPIWTLSLCFIKLDSGIHGNVHIKLFQSVLFNVHIVVRVHTIQSMLVSNYANNVVHSNIIYKHETANN